MTKVIEKPRHHFYSLLLAAGLCCAAQTLWAKDSAVYVLTSGDWNVPRTTRTVLDMPALRKTIQAYNKHPGARLQIHYPGGDEGTLWVSELRSWLVSLGIASNRIDLLPGTRKPGQLELRVVVPAVIEGAHAK